MFTGTFPSTIGRLINLMTLNLSYNQIGGLIPFEIGNMKSLTGLYLNNNMFIDPIPSTIGNSSNLSYLRINNSSLRAQSLSLFVDMVRFFSQLLE
ncbi:LRR receptor kinase BAK1, partial [Cucurbita argyrosperma subsp. argyrosperma]